MSKTMHLNSFVSRSSAAFSISFSSLGICRMLSLVVLPFFSVTDWSLIYPSKALDIDFFIVTGVILFFLLYSCCYFFWSLAHLSVILYAWCKKAKHTKWHTWNTYRLRLFAWHTWFLSPPYSFAVTSFLYGAIVSLAIILPPMAACIATLYWIITNSRNVF